MTHGLLKIALKRASLAKIAIMKPIFYVFYIIWTVFEDNSKTYQHENVVVML